MKKIVEDSTKGTAPINPVSYKGDALIQVWIDSRVLATLSNWLDTGGMFTRFLSEVVKNSLQILCDHLEDSGAVTMVDDTATARDLIYRKYRVNLNPQGRGMKNALHNIVLSDRRKSLRGQIEARQYKTNVNVPCGDNNQTIAVDDDLVKQGMEMLKSIREVNKPEVATVKEGMTDKELEEFDKRDAELLKKQNEEIDKLLGIKRTENE